MAVLYLAIGLVAGFFIGVFLVSASLPIIGTMIVNQTDPGEELMEFEFEKTLGEIFGKRLVLLRVKNNSQSKLRA